MLARALVSMALAALAAGCPEPRAPAPAAPSARPAAGARGGIKVPLPDGWAALVGPDDALRAGPPGHAVLRIEPRPGAGASLPTTEALGEALRSGLKEAQFHLVNVKSEPEQSILVYRLTPKSAVDAGGSAEAPGMLGAKRIGRDLFLCSSIPGASDEEAGQAALACAGLSVPPS